MRVRVFRLRSENPVVAGLLVLLILLVVVAVLVAGATLLAGVAAVAAVVGGATLLGRRVLGLGRRTPPPALPPLDPANEVFPGDGRDAGGEHPRLPPAP